MQVLKLVEIKRQITWRFWATRILPVGFFMALTLHFGNVVYLYLTVSFIQMLKVIILHQSWSWPGKTLKFKLQWIPTQNLRSHVTNFRLFIERLYSSQSRSSSGKISIDWALRQRLFGSKAFKILPWVFGYSKMHFLEVSCQCRIYIRISVAIQIDIWILFFLCRLSHPL